MEIEFYDVKDGTFPVFETVFGRMAALICADGNYTDVVRKLAANGAQLIAAPTKNSLALGSNSGKTRPFVPSKTKPLW